MKAHLTDQEWLDYVNHEANEVVHAHLQFCRECREEAERLGTTLVQFAESVKAEAALSQQNTRRSAPARLASLPYRRWALAVAAVLVLAAGMFLLPRRSSAPAVAHKNGAPVVDQPSPVSVKPAVQPQVNAMASQEAEFAAEEDEDDLLLLQVQNDAALDMPEALQPVAMILAERNQFAEQLTQDYKGEY